MSEYFETYTEEVFLRFKEIDESAYREVITFYESNEDVLLHLELSAYLEVRMAYSDALFEIGRYRDFILLCDELIEEVIFHNIKYVGGQDVFEKLLFKKAAAYYHQMNYDEAEHILWQLIRMNPQNSIAAYLLKRCKVKNQPSYLRRAKSVSIFLFLLSATIIAIELLIIQPFFSAYHSNVEIIRSSLFLFGIFLLVISDGWHRLKSFHTVTTAVDRAKRNRA